jgi:target of EGR1 protein 1
LTDALPVMRLGYWRPYAPFSLHSGTAQGLYASLPATLTTFVADIESLCRGGLVDTKYIADYHARDPASFLEYLFRYT